MWYGWSRDAAFGAEVWHFDQRCMEGGHQFQRVWKKDTSSKEYQENLRHKRLPLAADGCQVGAGLGQGMPFQERWHIKLHRPHKKHLGGCKVKLVLLAMPN